MIEILIKTDLFHSTRMEFEKRAKEVITAMAEQGLNTALYYENPNPKEYISMIPTSAHSGDGMGNLMALLVQLSQTMLAKRLAYSDELQATVLEVKAIPGKVTTAILTEFFDFTFESISVSCNFDSNTSEIQKILSNRSGQQGTFLKLRQA